MKENKKVMGNMALQRRLNEAIEVTKSFLRSPTYSGRVLRDLPKTSQSLTFSENWQTANTNSQATIRIDETNLEHSNHLRHYFDNNKVGPGIWKWLHYFDIYQRHFHKFIGREVHIVEIGIYSGGSLPMWHQYFGPKCHVYGVDIEPACQAYENDRTKVFIGDQADRDFWKRFREQVPVVDIVLDDGGHLDHQQIVTLEEMLPHLQPGGIFFCEDVLGTDNPFSAYVYGLMKNLNTQNWQGISHIKPTRFQQAIHSIHSYPFVTVIEKNEHAVSEFIAPKLGTEWQPFL